MADPIVEEIKQRVDIIDLVSQKVVLKKAGRSHKGLCPFHQEKTPSFVVYPDQGTFHCFGCGKSGDAFTWLQETEHLDFGEALRRLAAQTGVQLPDRAPQKVDPEAQAAVDALQESATWYQEQLLHAPSGQAARDYLQRRGLKRETVERFGLGWAPDGWDALASHLRTRGYSTGQLEEAGLASHGERGLYDRFRGRVIFPIRNAEGRVRGFGGRIIVEAQETPEGHAARRAQPKYLNSPQTPFFDKGATLYGLDLAKGAIRQEGHAVIVEGYLDAVLPHQEGFSNVVASLGTALTEHQVDLLKRYTSTIVLALDADAAGQAATMRALEVARRALFEQRRPVPGPATRTGYLQLASGQIKIAVLSGGKDPDEIVREDPAAWRRLVHSALPMMDHKMEVELGQVEPDDAQSKIAAVQELARFLVQVPDAIEWGHYIDRIAQRLRLDIRSVKDEVDRAARAMKPAQASAARGRAPQISNLEHTPPPGTGTAPEAAVMERSSGPEATPRTATSALDQAGEGEGSPAPGRGKGSVPTGDHITEEHFISLLVFAPHLIRQLPARLEPGDFRRPECRELYRTVQTFGERHLPPPVTADPHWPASASGANTDDLLRATVDGALLAYYDALLMQARRRPPQTPSQMVADLADVVRRIKERNLRDQLREAQYLLDEAGTGEDRLALQRQVERLAAYLGRVQLERSRTALYTSPLR